MLDAAGRSTVVTVIAGTFASVHAPSPPPKSWASRSANDVQIWTLQLAPGAKFDLPATASGANRMAYFSLATGCAWNGRAIPAQSAVHLRADTPASFENGATPSEILILQARPIGEPVVQKGPFVMNTTAEIQQAFADYRATGFGGWPWGRPDPVHDRQARFARHADGHVERG